MTQHTREQELIPYYDGKLEYYSPAQYRDLKRITERVNAPQTGSMLDVGCGDARAYRYARDHSMRYTGVDYSDARLKKARKTWGWGPELIRGSLYDVLPSLRQTFDLIWCCELLEHLEEPTTIWEAMKKLCSDLVVCTCPVNMPHEAHLQVFETEEQMRETFPGITELSTIRCETPGGFQRPHFVFTYKVT